MVTRKRPVPCRGFASARSCSVALGAETSGWMRSVPKMSCDSSTGTRPTARTDPAIPSVDPFAATCVSRPSPSLAVLPHVIFLPFASQRILPWALTRRFGSGLGARFCPGLPHIGLNATQSDAKGVRSTDITVGTGAGHDDYSGPEPTFLVKPRISQINR